MTNRECHLLFMCLAKEGHPFLTNSKEEPSTHWCVPLEFNLYCSFFPPLLWVSCLINAALQLWLQLRVSGLISNGPYVLAVDCDMYSNDPTSAKQAMCFFLDPETSKYIAFVQFPQMFHNLSKKDIYDNQSRTAFKVSIICPFVISFHYCLSVLFDRSSNDM